MAAGLGGVCIGGAEEGRARVTSRDLRHCAGSCNLLRDVPRAPCATGRGRVSAARPSRRSCAGGAPRFRPGPEP